jgi:hypothetical protein
METTFLIKTSVKYLHLFLLHLFENGNGELPVRGGVRAIGKESIQSCLLDSLPAA